MRKSHSPKKSEESRWKVKRADSGFLSNSSLGSEEEKSAALVPDPMKVDSGVDLSGTLSQLTLEPVTLNPLSVDGVRRNFLQKEEENTDKGSKELKKRVQESWQLYYSQNETGDT